MSGTRSLVLRRAGALLQVATVILITACAGPDKPKPKPLEAIVHPMSGSVLWKQRIGDVRFPMAVAVNTGVFTVADSGGAVVALQADTGRELWRGEVGAKLGAGVGSDGHFAAVVTRDGELVVLEAGKVIWRKGLGLRVTTAPLVAGERVFVLGLDRSVQAFDAQDGNRLWSVQRPGDALTLSQAGVILAFKDTLLVGQGARLTGLDPTDGSVRFEASVATPRGTNEVERLADLIGPAARVGDIVCARAFQAAVGCIDAQRGSLSWTKAIAGNEGVTADEQSVYGADASDRITAWKMGNGDVEWSTEKLMYRGLSTPLAVGPAVLFGDDEGLVHFVSRDTGETLLRLPTDGRAITTAPVRSGNTVLVVTRGGGLYALRAE